MSNELINIQTISSSSTAISSRFLPNPTQNPVSNSRTRLPAELLILNRYGIGYPYLKAAWKISQRYQIAPSEILIKSKVISLDIWLDAQEHLARERQRVIAKRKLEALLLHQSINNLSNVLPHYSAKTTFTKWQFIFIALCTSISILLFY